MSQNRKRAEQLAARDSPTFLGRDFLMAMGTLAMLTTASLLLMLLLYADEGVVKIHVSKRLVGSLGDLAVSAATAGDAGVNGERIKGRWALSGVTKLPHDDDDDDKDEGAIGVVVLAKRRRRRATSMVGRRLEWAQLAAARIQNSIYTFCVFLCLYSIARFCIIPFFLFFFFFYLYITTF